MSNINFTCPHCSFSKQLPASAEGQQGNCPSCNAVVNISADSPRATSAVPLAVNVNPTPQVSPSSTPPPLTTQTKEWFYSKDDQQLGPFSEQELVTLLSKDATGPSLFVWKERMENWVEARTVLPLVNQPNVDVSDQESTNSKKIIIFGILGLVVVVAGVFVIIATLPNQTFENAGGEVEPDPTAAAVWHMPDAPPADYEQTEDYTSDPDAEAPVGPDSDPEAEPAVEENPPPSVENKPASRLTQSEQAVLNYQLQGMRIGMSLTEFQRNFPKADFRITSQDDKNTGIQKARVFDPSEVQDISGVVCEFYQGKLLSILGQYTVLNVTLGKGYRGTVDDMVAKYGKATDSENTGDKKTWVWDFPIINRRLVTVVTLADMLKFMQIQVLDTKALDDYGKSLE